MTGQSVVLDYSYIFGTDIAAAIGGPNNITGTRTVAELLAGTVNPVFDGGTLAFTTPLALSTSLSLEAGGGTIDTQGNDAAISGVLSGVGALTKAGEGTLMLSGANSYTGGTTISGGRLVGDTVSLQGDIVNNATVEFAQANDGIYGSAISGTGGLVKSGSGTLTLSGANSYTGGTTVSGGRLVGDTVSLQGDIVNNATVEFAQATDGSYGGGLSGTGGLVKSGAGTLTLNGANSYTGGTTVSDGRLVGNTAFLQGDIVNNATVEFAQANDGIYGGGLSGTGGLVKSGSGTLTLSGANSYTGGTNVSGGRLVGSTASLQGDIVNDATVEFAQANDGSYGSAISGTGGLVKSGSGTLILSGTNSYTGGTTVSDGRLIGNTASLQGDIVNDATVEFAQANDGSYGSAISGTGGLVKSGSGTLTLGGTNSYTGGITISGGRLIGNTASLQGDIINTATVEFAQANDGTYGNAIAGTGGLVKSGAGTLTLSGANSYTGGTTISGGRLIGNTASLQGDIVNNATLEFAQANDGGYGSAISGTGGLVKSGAGTLTLSGANSYTGGTTVSGGRLIGNTASLQGDIINTATVEFAQANDGGYGSTISGTGAFVKSGSGTLTLSGANSYTGGTNIAGGTLVAGNSAAIGTGAMTIGAAQLKAGNALALANAVILTDRTSAVDTAGFDVGLSGNLSGSGTLTKLGTGTLTLSGANSQNGIIVAGGVLAFGSDAALGRAGSVVTIQEDTTLRTLADFTIDHEIFVNDTQRAKFDSNGHDIVMAGDITGSGNIEKIGTGTLTLTGSNANVTINVLAGRVIAQSQGAIGGTGGDITLHTDGGFTAGSNMTVSQNLHVAGTNSTFDTGAFDVTLNGTTDGSACLVKTGSGRLNLIAAGGNTVGACVEQGTLAFNNVFQGNVTVEESGTASGSGLIVGNVQVDGVLSPGNSPGQLIVAGSVTQAAGSTLAIDVDGTTAGNGAGHYDTLVLTGAGGLYTAGGTIRPTLRGITGSATNSFTPQIGETFQVVSAEAGVAGSFAALTQPTDGLAANTRFDVVYRTNAIILAVTPGSYAAFADRSNAAAAGRALDSVRGLAGVRDVTASGRLFDGLAGLNSDRLALTLEQLSGSVHADALDAATRTLRSARGSVGQHLDTPVAQSTSLWSSVNRDHVRVRADGSGQGYSAESYNLVLGVDTQATRKLVLGTAFAYSTSAVRTAGLGKSDDAHYQGLVYANWASNGSYLRGTLSFGIDDYKVSRQVSLSDGTRQLDSRPDGFSYGADIEAGHRLGLGKVALTPFAGIMYDRVEREGFTENGDAAVALRFLNDHRNAWQVRGGANVSTSFPAGSAVLTPYANAAVTHEIGDVAARVNPLLNGAIMTVDAASFGKTGVQGGVGIGALFSQKVSLTVGYRYKDTANARQHSVNAGISLRW